MKLREPQTLDLVDSQETLKNNSILYTHILTSR